jgi:putative endopeptidase
MYRASHNLILLRAVFLFFKLSKQKPHFARINHNIRSIFSSLRSKAITMNFFRKSFSFVILLAISTGALAQFNPSRMDSGAMACDNFYKYTNGTWLKTTEIPAAFPSWGTWDILGTRNRELSRDILEAASKTTGAAKGSSAQLIGDYYASCMDTAAINAAGATPLDPYFKDIAGMKNTKDLQDEIGKLGRLGLSPAFGFYPYFDQKDSTITIFNVSQGGLGLPTKEYYTKQDDPSKAIRDKYVTHTAKMFELLGDTPAQAKANADTVMKMENRFAMASKDLVQLRDPESNYHKMSVADANKLTSNFNWENYAAKIGAPKFTQINVGQPEFFAEFNKMMTDIPMEDWKTFLRWNVVNSFAGSLAKPFDDENFDFYNRTLYGVKEQQPRWRVCSRAADNSLGEALGEEFVKTNFSPDAKARMSALIDNLFAAYREHINKVDWMTEETRKQALLKLSAIKRKIGYPDKPRGYAGLTVTRKSYVDNNIAINEFAALRDLQDIGHPPDKTRWQMTAATVNAQYNPNFNDITFPAGILQPPFFDAKSDDALNYGAIGSVIGHELTHGFDDQGSQYDADGNLKMWWTPDDRKKFDEKASCVTAQFSSYEPVKGLFIKGEQTLGENLADLGGIAIAYDAFLKSMEGKPRPTSIDAFTPEQRFFLGWAQAWAENDRAEWVDFLVKSDVHSIAEFRVNGPLSNMPEFAGAFGCKMGDKMVRQKPCKVW